MKLLIMRVLDAITSSTYGNAALNTKLGTPAGASVSADVAAVKTDTGNLVTRVGTPAELTSLTLQIGKGDDAVGSLGTAAQSLHSKLRAILANMYATTVKVYPTLAASVTATEAAGANTLGAFASIAAINVITSAYIVDALVPTAISAAGVFEAVLYHGASDTEFARVRFSDLAAGIPIPLPVKKLLAANDVLKVKIASVAGGVKTVDFSIIYH